MYLLICPHCKNKMKYQSSNGVVSEKKKRCVYCGKSFLVRPQILSKID